MINKAVALVKTYRLELVAFFVGLVILAFELVAARVVAPYLGTTIYVWTSIIGVILAALAVGYSLGGYLADRRGRAEDIVVLLVVGAAGILLVNIVKDWFLAWISGSGTALQLEGFLSSLVLFTVPTIALGAVSPYLARLSITSVKSSGRHLARISAAGTVGSLAGTFLTGYFLFGYVGTRRLLGLLALGLLLLTLFEKSRRLWGMRLALAAVAVIQIFVASPPRLSNYTAETDTAYSRVIIRDVFYNGGPVRVLQNDNEAWQSGVYTDGRPGLVFDYAKGFSYVSQAVPGAKDFLVIGGGAFTVPAWLAANHVDGLVDAVEIDDQMPAVSQQWFNFQPSAAVNIITADGRQFLNNNSKKYDVVVLDAYNSVVPPFQLLSTEAVELMARALKPGGVVVCNFISAADGPKSRLIDAAYSTFSQHFDEVRVFQVTPRLAAERTQNLMMIASVNALNNEALDAVAAEHVDFAAMLRTTRTFPVDERKILTDDFAPIERLVL